MVITSEDYLGETTDIERSRRRRFWNERIVGHFAVHANVGSCNCSLVFHQEPDSPLIGVVFGSLQEGLAAAEDPGYPIELSGAAFESLLRFTKDFPRELEIWQAAVEADVLIRSCLGVSA